MLFLQGSRDALAATELIEALVQRLGERATLKLFEDADHSFHVPAKTGRKDAEVRSKVLDELSAWRGWAHIGQAIPYYFECPRRS